MSEGTQASNVYPLHTVSVEVQLTQHEAEALAELALCSCMTESELIGELIEAEWFEELEGRATEP